MTDRDIMKLALEALCFGLHVGFDESSESQIKKSGVAFDHHSRAVTALRGRLAHCDRCGKKLGGEGDIHTCTPLIGCVQHDCAECKARLAQPEQEPYGYVSDDENLSFQKEKPEIGRWIKVFTAAPAQRKPLTDEEIASIYMNHTDRPLHAQWNFARAIEAAHGIKE